MDAELRKYLDSKFQEINDNSSRNHEQTRQEVGAIRRSVWILWNQVFGSDPPSPQPGQDPRHVLTLKPEDKDLIVTPREGQKPLNQKISNHDLDIASLHSMVITVNRKMDEAFDELKKHFSDDAMVEIVAVISLLGWLNRWAQTVVPELEPAAAAFARENLKP